MISWSVGVTRVDTYVYVSAPAYAHVYLCTTHVYMSMHTQTYM